MDSYLPFKLIVYSIILYKTESVCEFPEDIRGEWLSSQKGYLVFTNSTIEDYPAVLAAGVNSVTFECDHTYNDTYILRGVDTFEVFGQQYRAHLCIILTKISNDSFFYYLGTGEDLSTGEYVFVRNDIFNVTDAEICNRQMPYEPLSFIMLVKNGSSDSTIQTKCPNNILRTFGHSTIKSNNGMDNCTDIVTDVCSNTSVVHIQHQHCNSTDIKFSASGELICMHHVISNDVSYISMWNTDDVLDPKSHRITCYAVQETDGVTYVTEYPGVCHLTQNATFVLAPGLYLQLSNITENCAPVFTTPTTASQAEAAVQVATAFIVGGVLGGLVVLLLIAILIYIFCRCCKQTKRQDIKETSDEKEHTPKISELPRPKSTKRQHSSKVTLTRLKSNLSLISSENLPSHLQEDNCSFKSNFTHYQKERILSVGSANVLTSQSSNKAFSRQCSKVSTSQNECLKAENYYEDSTTPNIKLKHINEYSDQDSRSKSVTKNIGICDALSNHVATLGATDGTALPLEENVILIESRNTAIPQDLNTIESLVNSPTEENDQNLSLNEDETNSKVEKLNDVGLNHAKTTVNVSDSEHGNEQENKPLKQISEEHILNIKKTRSESSTNDSIVSNQCTSELDFKDSGENATDCDKIIVKNLQLKTSLQNKTSAVHISELMSELQRPVPNMGSEHSNQSVDDVKLLSVEDLEIDNSTNQNQEQLVDVTDSSEPEGTDRSHNTSGIGTSFDTDFETSRNGYNSEMDGNHRAGFVSAGLNSDTDGSRSDNQNVGANPNIDHSGAVDPRFYVEANIGVTARTRHAIDMDSRDTPTKSLNSKYGRVEVSRSVQTGSPMSSNNPSPRSINSRRRSSLLPIKPIPDYQKSGNILNNDLLKKLEGNMNKSLVDMERQQMRRSAPGGLISGRDMANMNPEFMNIQDENPKRTLRTRLSDGALLSNRRQQVRQDMDSSDEDIPRKTYNTYPMTRNTSSDEDSTRKTYNTYPTKRNTLHVTKAFQPYSPIPEERSFHSGLGDSYAGVKEVPSVIAGYEMARFNPPDAFKSVPRRKPRRTMSFNDTLVSNDFIWCSGSIYRGYKPSLYTHSSPTRVAPRRDPNPLSWTSNYKPSRPWR